MVTEYHENVVYIVVIFCCHYYSIVFYEYQTKRLLVFEHCFLLNSDAVCVNICYRLLKNLNRSSTDSNQSLLNQRTLYSTTLIENLKILQRPKLPLIPQLLYASCVSLSINYSSLKFPPLRGGNNKTAPAYDVRQLHYSSKTK